MSEGLYVLIVGPTAVGKDTVLRILQERMPDAKKPVNATTRDPRPGEIDGVHFHFLTEEEFIRRREAGDFLEWNVYGTGRLYGSVESEIRRMLEEGKLVLNIVDVNGARSTKAKLPRTLSVFLMPESADQLERQIRKGSSRKAIGDEEVRRRLRTARQEMGSADEFDLIVVNRDGRVEETVDEVQAFILGRFRPRGS